MQLSDLGTDFNSNYEFVDGDLKLISDTDNLAQSITNRLNTRLGEMSVFYNNYGSYLRTYMGDRKTDTLLQFLNVEVSTVLRQDPRLQDASVECSFDTDNKVIIYINASFDDETDLSLNLVMSEEYGVDIIGD